MRRRSDWPVAASASLPPLSMPQLWLWCALLLLASCPPAFVGPRVFCVAHEHGGSSSSSSDDDAPLLLHRLIPREALREAWEVHPLLATGYRRDRDRETTTSSSSDDDIESGCGRGDGDFDVGPPSPSCPAGRNVGDVATTASVVNDEGDTIPTVVLSSAALDDRLGVVHRTLFGIDDIKPLLSRYNLYGGTNCKVLRKIRYPDGTEYHEDHPKSGRMMPDEILRAVYDEGYSLSVNAVQRHWEPVSKLARKLWGDAGCYYVNANLYLTPAVGGIRGGSGSGSGGGGDGGADGANPAPRNSAFNPHWDWMDVVVLQLHGTKLWSMTRRPHSYLSPRDRARELTVEESWLFVEEKYDDFLVRPGDVLYFPRGFVHNASTISLRDAALSGFGIDPEVLETELSDPSLHLTLGLEHNCETTVEALLHHAIRDYYLRTHPDRNKKAISRKDCPESQLKIRWSTVLHLYLGAMARTGGCDVDDGSNRSGDGDNEEEAVCRLLRRSAAAPNLDRDAREDMYRVAVDAVTHVGHLGAPDPVDIVVEFATALRSDAMLSTAFCFPARLPWDEIACPRALGGQSMREELPVQLAEFRDFALGRYEEAMELMEEHLSAWRGTVIERDDSELASS